MNKYIVIISLFLTSIIFAQTEKNIVEKTFDNIKSKTKIDKLDSTCFNLTQKMYDEVLQNEISEFKKSTIEEINEFQKNRKSKNTYLFTALMFYQEIVTKSAEQKVVKPELQRDIVNYLEKEFLYVYNKIPTIIYVYKVETLNLFEDKTELKKYINEGLKNYPNSIPLKYYSYKYLNEQTYKEDLMKLNKKHWLIYL
ncbi:hypothetical protein [Flavobacterium sp.]|uniref:hypothetical protein n=1 Tax=Flavobacterium sp. TaxID=239 RepID=UPI0040489D1F